MSVVEYAWEGRDNQFKLMLEIVEDNSTVASDLSDVTEALFELQHADGSDGPSITVQRDDANAIIDWWDADLDTGEMLFKLGLWAETFAYDTPYKGRLTLTTPNSSNGIVWISWGNSYLTPLSVTFFETA